jgi:non-specific serine/threonine protein kinase
MGSGVWGVSIDDGPARIWAFGLCEWNEASRELRVNGVVSEVETKPLEVLSQLLQHAGEVVTKEELLEAVWPDTSVVDGSLATAVSKLRKALGDEAQEIVVTMPRIGYRLGVSVRSRAAISEPGGYQTFSPGDVVPGREQWVLHTKLAASDGNHVWLSGTLQDTGTAGLQIRTGWHAAEGAEAGGYARAISQGIVGRAA